MEGMSDGLVNWCCHVYTTFIDNSSISLGRSVYVYRGDENIPPTVRYASAAQQKGTSDADSSQKRTLIAIVIPLTLIGKNIVVVFLHVSLCCVCHGDNCHFIRAFSIVKSAPTVICRAGRLISAGAYLWFL